MKIARLLNADIATLKQINALVSQLSRTPIPLSIVDLRRVLKNPNVELWVVCEGRKIVGMGALVAVIMFTNKYAHFDEVVVDKEYRGKGFGEAIMRKLIARARSHKAKGIELTSGFDRKVANKLYKKLGFQLRDTNAYRLKL